MARATHSGHCQACGRLQKLPEGSLSLHGYTVAHGFFAGTCEGSRQLPFEVSRDYVGWMIKRAEAALVVEEKMAAEYRADASKVVTVSVYDRTANRHRGGYVRKTGVVVAEQRGTFVAFSVRLDDGGTYDHRNGFRVEGYDKTVEERIALATADLREKHAQATFDREANQLRRYIAWQRERYDAWTPQPLLPVDAKADKQGFDPEEVR